MNTRQKKKELLKNCKLFKNFSDEVINAIVPRLTITRYKKDSIICLKGDESDYLYIIDEGEVEISVSSTDGKEILLGTLRDGDAFGELGLLDQGSRTANVSSKTEVSLYCLSNHDFNDIVELFSITEFRAITSYICFLFRSVTNNLEDAVFHDATVRIARQIESLYKKSQGTKDENSFSASISQEDLGRMAGLSREATNKALQQLEKKKLIERQYKCITVPDMRKFQREITG